MALLKFAERDIAGMASKTIKINTRAGRMKLIILREEGKRVEAKGSRGNSARENQAIEKQKLPGILWIHGGGYVLGMAGMVYMSIGKMLAKKFRAVVVSPAYRLAYKAPYPAAFEDCCDALLYMYEHADELGIDPERIIVGGESAGGGLAAAVCLYARDTGRVSVMLQIPLYPMIDCEDTETSKNNHGHVWNTRRNHWGWRRYLKGLTKAAEGAAHHSAVETTTKDFIPKYASPARETDYSNLPPCVTFVEDGEPFYAETLAYVANLKKAGVEAKVKVYHGKTHAFDMLLPWTKNAKAAKRWLCRSVENYFSV